MRSHSVDQEFADLARRILAEGLGEKEWAEIESDDMFESEHYAGGFDATEKAFCFSYYDAASREYWFQLTLGELEEVVNGLRTELQLSEPE